MSCIHFKFSNTFENDKIKFDGLQISLADLKESIVKQKNLKSNMYTLKIIDSQSKKEYSEDQEMLPRNTSVIVSRVPLAVSQRIPKSKFKDPTLPQSDSVLSKRTPPPIAAAPAALRSKDASEKMLSAEELKKTADLASANATEEDKVMAMMSQAGEGYDPSQYVWTPRGASKAPGISPGLKNNPPPPTYTCYRCGNRGHWIQLCPTNGDPSFNNRRYTRSMGTPSSQMVTVNENMAGAMLNRFGQLVVREVDLKAVRDFKMKNKQPPPERTPKELETPAELVCTICKELMKEAVIIPCCGESYCFECIQEYLCENEFTCPACKESNVSPDNLAPNKALRKSAKNFQMKAAEDKSVAMASGTGFIRKAPLSMASPLKAAVTASTITPHVPPSATKVEGKAQGQGGGESVPSQPGKLEEKKEEVKVNQTTPAVKGIEQANKKEASDVTKSDSPVPIDATTAVTTTTTTGATTATTSSSQNLLSAIRPERKVKSRSGSPSNLCNAVSIKSSSLGGGGIGGVASRMGELLNLQKSSLSTSAIPGMLPGVPLTSGGLALGARQPHFPPVHVPGMPPSLIPPPQLPLTATIPPAGFRVRSGNITSSDPTKLDRLAAELLLNSAVSNKKRNSPSPPPAPLSVEEFYRQQKLLKFFAKPGQQGSSGSSRSYSSGSYSRSSSSDSFYSNSRSRSSSSDYSRGRSHSRSPYRSRHKPTSRRHLQGQKKSQSKERKHHLERKERRVKGHRETSRDKPSRGHQESERRKEKVRREKNSAKYHHHSKRRRHRDSSGGEDRKKVPKAKRSRRRPSRSRSPDDGDGIPLEELGTLATVRLSSDPSITTPPNNDVEEMNHESLSLPLPSSPSHSSPPRLVVPELDAPSLHKSKHKKKTKKKHKHRRRESEDVVPWDADNGGIKKEKEGPAQLGDAAQKVDGDDRRKEEDVSAGGQEQRSVDDPVAPDSEGKKIEPSLLDSNSDPNIKEKPGNGDDTLGSVPSQVNPLDDKPHRDSATKMEHPEVLPSTEVVATADGDVGMATAGLEVSPGNDVNNSDVVGDDVGMATAELGVTPGNDVMDDAVLEEPVEIAVHADDVTTLDLHVEEGKRSADTPSVVMEMKETPSVPNYPRLTKADLGVILDHLGKLSDWKSLGLELRVPGRKLHRIPKKDNPLERVILYWLESCTAKEKPTWKCLANALKNMGKSSLAARINRKQGKEEGEISDSEDDIHRSGNLPDLRQTLQGEPDLRETINSHSGKRKHHTLTELQDQEGTKKGGEEDDDEEEVIGMISMDAKDCIYEPSSKKFKNSKGKVRSVASSSKHRLLSDSDSSSEGEEDNNMSPSSSESGEVIAVKRRKRSKSSGKHLSSDLTSKKHKSRSHEDKHRNKNRGKERDGGGGGGKEKKAKKDKKHRDHKHHSSSGEHKHSSHKSKKSSRTEQQIERKEKKQKKHHKKSLHSDRSRH